MPFYSIIVPYNSYGFSKNMGDQIMVFNYLLRIFLEDDISTHALSTRSSHNFHFTSIYLSPGLLEQELVRSHLKFPASRSFEKLYSQSFISASSY